MTKICIFKNNARYAHVSAYLAVACMFLELICLKSLFKDALLMAFYFQALHNIDPLIADFKSALEKVEARLDQFASLCQVEKNVSKTLFHRTKTAVQRLEKQKTLIEQLIRRFVQVVLQIVGSRNIHLIEGPAATDWLYALECVDAFNKVVKAMFHQIELRSKTHQKTKRVKMQK